MMRLAADRDRSRTTGRAAGPARRASAPGPRRHRRWPRAPGWPRGRSSAGPRAAVPAPGRARRAGVYQPPSAASTTHLRWASTRGSIQPGAAVRSSRFSTAIQPRSDRCHPSSQPSGSGRGCADDRPLLLGPGLVGPHRRVDRRLGRSSGPSRPGRAGPGSPPPGRRRAAAGRPGRAGPCTAGSGRGSGRARRSGPGGRRRAGRSSGRCRRRSRRPARTTSSDADSRPRRSPPAASAAARQATSSSGNGRPPARYVSTSPSTTPAPARMLPWAA